MKILFPDHKDHLISGSILVGNIYSSLGDYEKAATIRSNTIKEYGGKVKVALSWTEVDGEIAVKDFFRLLTKLKQLICFLFRNLQLMIVRILSPKKFMLK